MNYKNIIKGFEIVTGTEINSDLVHYRKRGALRGRYLGFPEIHEHYTIAFPGVTDITGSPDSGKSQYWQELLINMSLFYGTKHLLYFPDVGNKQEVISDLIHKYTGKTFDKRFKNRISEREIFDATPWILEHFKVLVKKDAKVKLTPYQFWDLAVIMKEELGVTTASIDSWKDMDNQHKFGRDDYYLADVLGYRNFIADTHSMHLAQIVHPLKTEFDKKGNRKPATPYDLKGGGEWYDNGRSILTVHRPDGLENAADIIHNKIKPRSIGKKGTVRLYFDKSKFRYYWLNDGEKTFAKKEIIIPKKVENKIPFTTKDNEDDLPF